MTDSVTILGSGSALPTYQNSPSGQMLSLNDKSFLIDCGEGVQLTMRQMGLKTARLYSIFISHLHGDHCFGLIGLISTLSMMNRTQPLHIYSHKDLQKLLQPLIEYHCGDMLSFEVIFHHINPRKQAVIFEDRNITVETIPLKHKVPTCGFLFRDKGQKRYAYVSDTNETNSFLSVLIFTKTAICWKYVSVSTLYNTISSLRITISFWHNSSY